MSTKERTDMIIVTFCRNLRAKRASKAFDAVSTQTEDFVGSNIEIRT